MNQGSRTITAAKGSIGNLGLKECDGGRGGSLRTERRFAEAMAKGREKVAGKGEGVEAPGRHKTGQGSHFCRHIRCGIPQAWLQAAEAHRLPSARRQIRPHACAAAAGV